MIVSDYYLWLDSLVNDGNHNLLIRYLYSQPYRWQFILDENRTAGGLNLRRTFANESGVIIQDVGSGPCSILEMLIALAGRMTEFLESDIFNWFWVLMRNLHLDEFDDNHFDESSARDILNRWLDREYDAQGNGSLFPVSRYGGDCRNLDVWGQMNIWIAENYPHTDDWLYN